MKETIKIVFLIFILLFFSLLFVANTEARQGCCSHHGGVCGCHCCDGTSLSSTCAPYYPQCNKPEPTYIPSEPEPEINKPSEFLKSDSLVPENSLPISNKYTAEVPKENNHYSWLIWVGIIVGGFTTYLFLKRRK